MATGKIRKGKYIRGEVIKFTDRLLQNEERKEKKHDLKFTLKSQQGSHHGSTGRE